MYKLLICILIALISEACTTNKRADRAGNIEKANQVKAINFTLEKTYPHDRDAYTEGLVFHDSQLFESTGSPDNYPKTRSVIGVVDLKTGRIDVKVELDRNTYFGEGILFFDNRLFQLTYLNQLAFIYDSKSYLKVGTFTYSNKQGWGLTTDGKSIIMSDGTNVITYLDPESFKVTKQLNVTFNGSSARFLNELEYIDGFIYANIFTTNNIAKIDPVNGKIVGVLDLSSLYFKAKNEYQTSEATNGIAYDQKTGRIFVTGKFWPYIFQIKFIL